MYSKQQTPILCPHCGNNLGLIANLQEKCSCGFNVNTIAGVPLLWSAGREEPFDLTDEAREAWSKIAPGMDCYATKPEISS